MPDKEYRKQNYGTADIRWLLTQALSDEQLDALCFDRFRPVYESFSKTQSRSTKIHVLIEHCERYNKFKLLLREVQQRNPSKYTEYMRRVQQTTQVDFDNEDKRHYREMLIQYKTNLRTIEIQMSKLSPGDSAWVGLKNAEREHRWKIDELEQLLNGK